MKNIKHCFYVMLLAVFFLAALSVKASADIIPKIVTMNVGEQKWFSGLNYYTISHEWSVTDSSVINIISPSTSSLKCQVEALKAGKATLIYKHRYNQPTLVWNDLLQRAVPGYVESLEVVFYDITVNQPPTGIEMKKSVSVMVGDSYTLTASFVPSGSICALTWRSSDTAIAEVAGGKITTKAVGKVNITAVGANNIQAVCQVTVTKLAIPKPMKAESIAYNTIKFTWQDKHGFDGYVIYRKTGTGAWAKLATAKKGETSYVDNIVKCGQSYAYTVKAYRNIGSGKVYSDYDTAGIEGCAIPAKPSLSGMALGESKGNYLQWGKVSGAAGYEVYRKIGDASYKIIKPTTGICYTDTDLKKATGTMYYKVRAFRTEAGKKIVGGYSNTVSIKPNTSQTSLTAQVTGFDRLSLSWKAVSCAGGYQIYRSDSLKGTYKKVADISGAKTTTYTNSGLSSGKAYYYKIRPYITVSGKSSYGIYSGAVSAKTAGVKVAAVSAKSISISWEKVSNASGYCVARASSETGDYAEVARITNSSKCSFTDNNTLIGQTYYYMVAPYTDAGCKKKSGYSVAVSAKTMLDTPSISFSSGSIIDALAPRLIWPEVDRAEGYSVYQSIDGGSYEKLADVASVNSPEYNLRGLEEGKKYSYKIRAFAVVNGNRVYSAYSNVVSKEISHSGGDPLQVNGLTVSSSSVKTGTSVTWTINVTGGSSARQCRFILYKDDVQLNDSGYKAPSTFTYTPQNAGTYKVTAEVKDGTVIISMSGGSVTVTQTE